MRVTVPLKLRGVLCYVWWKWVVFLLAPDVREADVLFSILSKYFKSIWSSNGDDRQANESKMLQILFRDMTVACAVLGTFLLTVCTASWAAASCPNSIPSPYPSASDFSTCC